MRKKVVVKRLAMDKSSGFQAENFHHIFLNVNEAKHGPKNNLRQCILLHINLNLSIPNLLGP
jgi:hypothetical protein